MAEADRGDQHDVTIPAAVARRPLLVALVAITGLVAGIWFSGFGDETYRATATIVVEDPRTTEEGAILLAPERYVAEQVAIFDLDTIATAAAEIATTEHQDALRQRSASVVALGDDNPVIVGIDGSITIEDDRGTLAKSSEEEISTTAAGTPILDEDATVVRDDGSPVLDAQGRQVFVGSTDGAVVRTDGLIVVARTDQAPIVVTPDGVAIESFADADLPSGVTPNEEGGVTVDAGSFSVEVARGLRPVVRDERCSAARSTGEDRPVGGQRALHPAGLRRPAGLSVGQRHRRCGRRPRGGHRPRRNGHPADSGRPDRDRRAGVRRVPRPVRRRRDRSQPHGAGVPGQLRHRGDLWGAQRGAGPDRPRTRSWPPTGSDWTPMSRSRRRGRSSPRTPPSLRPWPTWPTSRPS